MLAPIRSLVYVTLTLLVIVVPAVAQEPAPRASSADPVAPPPVPDRQPQAPPSPAARPPFPNRANDVLPAWLHVRGEFRERMEGGRGIGFTAGRQDLYYLSRLRLQATITPARLLAVQVQAQDARVAGKSIGPAGTPFSAPFDLRTAFLDVGNARTPLALRVGRQELAFGEQRLVGHVGWLNAARSFDGARLTVRTAALAIDAFATSVVRIMPDAFDRSGAGNRFAGTHVSTNRLSSAGTVDAYLFWRRDVDRPSELGPSGTLSQTTIGVRLARPLPWRFDYGVEMAVQRGSLAADTIRAWAGHWRLRQSLPGRGAVRLIGEYNYASGDADPADGVRGTFDVLYPTPHDKYGLADQIGWKNLHHARAGVEITPWRGLPVGASYHSWWLASRGDGAYTAGGAPLARSGTGIGTTSRHIGQEIDIQASRMLAPQIQLAAGYAHVLTGPFLKEATPGASYSHPYVMVTYVFLAER